MPTDIFDQVAAPQSDIFDEVAKAPPAAPAPKPVAAAPKPDVFDQVGTISAYHPSTWQGIKDYASSLVEHARRGETPGGNPLPGMQTASDVGSALEPPSTANPNPPASAAVEVAKDVTGARGYPQMARGAKHYAESFSPEKFSTEGQASAARTRAGSEVVQGASEAMTPLLPVALASAPLKTAAYVGAGYAASEGGGAAAEKLGATREQTQLTKDVLWFLPSALAEVSGARTAFARGENGASAGRVTAFGDRVGAGFENTPEGFRAAARAGKAGVGIDIPKEGATSAPEVLPPATAAQAEAVRTQTEATATMGRSVVADKMATNIVNGKVPVEPPAPPPPSPTPISKGVVTPELLDGIAKAITSLPEEQRPQAMMEAHQKMTEALTQQGKVIGPDGSLHIVENPKQAAKLAQGWMNDKVAELDKAQTEAAKKPAEEPKPVEVANPKGILQKLKAAIEKATIGSQQERVIEESKKTVDKQVDALKSGNVPVVFIPAGASYVPKLPEGFSRADVPSKYKGGGIYFYDSNAVSAREIKQAAKEGTHGELMGHVQSKAELGNSPAVIVQAQDAHDHTPIQDSAIAADRPDLIQHQVEILQQRHPEAEIAVRPGHEVLGERMAAHPEGESALEEIRRRGNGAPAEKPPVNRVAKGDRVSFTDRSGKENTGTVNYAGELVTRIAGEDGKEHKVAPSKVKAAPHEHEFGSTQINIDKGSELGKKHAAAVAAIPDEHLGVEGRESTPHVTIRYGLKDDSPKAVARIREAVKAVPSFEAPIGKTDIFPPGEHSKGDNPVIAKVEPTSELRELRKAVQGAGEFKEDTFGEYKPHVTLGYVKTKFGEGYKGGSHLEGANVKVDHVVISKRDGSQEIIPLANAADSPATLGPEATAELAREAAPESAKLPQAEQLENARVDVQRQVRQLRANLDELASINPDFAKDFEARDDVQKLLAQGKEQASNGGAHEPGRNENRLPESPSGISPEVREGRGGDGAEPGRPEKPSTGNPDEEVTVRAIRSQVPGSHRTTLEVSKAGQSVGEIALSIKGKNASIEWAEVPENLRGKGHGSTLYDQAIKYAKERGVETLTSDTNGKITPEAERIWKSLVRKGEAEEQVGTPKYSMSLGGKIALSVPSGQIGELRTNLIHQAPGRFQYKLNTDAEGVGQLLKGQNIYNPDLAGTIAVWRDPADGKVYVVNGHHRLELAKRTGQQKVAVRHIVAKDASEARATGALQNIAEGRGTAIDAAKFLRDTGTTVQELERKGISMGEATASKGVAMAKLDDSLFNKVVQGDMSIERAVAIGEATDDHAEQKAISQLVDKQEAKGKKVSAETLRELVRFVKGSAKSEETTQSLFGSESIAKSHALEKAEVSAYVKQQLAKDKKLFGFVSKGERAEELERGNNIIDVNASKALADEAAQGEEVYNKLSERAGPIADELDKASARLAGGENANAVKQEAYSTIRQALSEALTGGQGASAGQRQAAATGRAAREASTAAPDETAHYRQTVNGEDLSSWATARDLKIEPQGEQPGLFGGSEKMYRLSRGDSSGNPDRILVTETQLDKLAAEHKNVRLAMQGTEAGGQDSLFGTPRMFGDGPKVVPGARSAFTGNETGKGSIQDLTDSINRQAPEKAGIRERLKIGASIGESSDGVVSKAVGKAKGITAALWSAYRNPRPSSLLPRDPTGTVSPYMKAVGEWDFADQHSASDLFFFRKSLERAVPDLSRRRAITHFIQADGDEAVLADHIDELKANPDVPANLVKEFEDALTLSDAEKTIARNTANRNEDTAAEMVDAELIKQAKENYMRQIWENVPEMQARSAAEANFASLVTNPSITKGSRFGSYFDGIMAGYKPKNTDFAYLTATHERALREALAARTFIKTLSEIKANDGRPVAMPSSAMAKLVSDDEPTGKDAVLITPNIKPGEELADYKYIDHPALRAWKWAMNLDGKDVFVKGDVLVHPDIYRHLKNNLSRSAIRSFNIDVGGKEVHPGKMLLDANALMKQAVLSLIPSRFHRTNLEGHALEHRTIPWDLPELDFNNAKQARLIKNGLKVAEYEGEGAWMEGTGQSAELVKNIPYYGAWAQSHADYLFKEVLPKLKMKTALNAYHRNLEEYKDKGYSDDKVAQITAKQMNAAFGNLNFRQLGRSRTMQDVLRLTLLAPDFFEARGRFVAQAARPEGAEQLKALILGAVVLYTVMRLLNEASDKDPHWDKPFSLVLHGKEYELRTVQGDILHLVTDPKGFFINRVSPVLGLIAKQDKYPPPKHETKMDAAKRIAKGHAPIPAQPWLRKSTDSTAEKAADTILKLVGVNVKKETKAAAK